MKPDAPSPIEDPFGESGSALSTAMLSLAVEITLGCSPGSLFSRTEPLTVPSIPTIALAASRLCVRQREEMFSNCSSWELQVV